MSREKSHHHPFSAMIERFARVERSYASEFCKFFEQHLEQVLEYNA